MKEHYINDIQVSKDTYTKYLDKEFKRVKKNCPCFSSLSYKLHDKIILNDIKFEEREMKQ